MIVKIVEDKEIGDYMDNNAFEKEYQDFMNKLLQKAAEVRADYYNLSRYNQNRILAKAEALLNTWRKGMNIKDLLGL